MPTFAYHVVDRTGRRHAGAADAPSSLALVRTLEERDLVVLHVDERSPPEHQARHGGGPFRSGARRRDVVEVTRALAALLPAGLPLARALDAASNLAHGAVAERLDRVRVRVERGDSLATALAEHGDVFPPVYVGLVRAGERSGDIDGAFTRLADQLEREEQLRAKLTSAMVYPAVLALVGGAAVLVLFLFVLPRFAELLGGAGAALPRIATPTPRSTPSARRKLPMARIGVAAEQAAMKGLSALGSRQALGVDAVIAEPAQRLGQ